MLDSIWSLLVTFVAAPNKENTSESARSNFGCWKFSLWFDRMGRHCIKFWQRGRQRRRYIEQSESEHDGQFVLFKRGRLHPCRQWRHNSFVPRGFRNRFKRRCSGQWVYHERGVAGPLTKQAVFACMLRIGRTFGSAFFL